MPTRARTSRGAPTSSARSGPPLEPGDAVLDLACGDGGLGDFLPEQRYLGVDASPEMVEAAPRPRPRHRAGRPERLRAVRARAGDADLPGDLLRARPARAASSTSRGYTETKLVFDLNPRQYRLADVRADLVAAGFDRTRRSGRSSSRRRARCRRRSRLCCAGSSEAGRLRGSLLRFRFTLLCAAFRSGASGRTDS